MHRNDWLNGDCNQAIMIRTFLSKNNTLYYQAGAGLVAKSNPESELQEVNNKLNALKKAVEKAEKISQKIKIKKNEQYRTINKNQIS
jgi:anthranilate synthase component 1